MKIQNKKLLCVEEQINIHALVKDLPVFAKRVEIDDAMIRRCAAQRPIDYVIGLLPQKGFCDAEGAADWVRFYKYARITPDVWSSFSSGKHAPSKDTLLKIIIALCLDEPEARRFLHLSGTDFSETDYRDRVIIACMECGYYEIEDVYEILEEYGSAMINGKRRFRNIY